VSDPDPDPGSDRQVERLRRVAEAALVAYDLDVADVSLITNDWNGVFRVDLTDGSRCVSWGCPAAAPALRSMPRWVGSTRSRVPPR